MKKFTLLLTTMLFGLTLGVAAADGINLTPVPKSMTIGTGKLTLPASFTIAANGLDESSAAEAQKFATLLGNVTGIVATVTDDDSDALVTMARYNGNEELGNEGYTLDITTDGIAISANSPTGFYYAFQTIKKLLPACVMAEVKDPEVTTFTLPAVSITDAPRFEYRGFMLDVSRHYFGLEQIKRMIDVMSYYKLNRFHWHLTDDQLWTFEVKKYPRLTTVGATRSNSWNTDPEYGGYYTGETYGPYYYTHEECREIVEYAAARHIEVVPEIEFPGHSCAVNAAYPELSCTPNGAHDVKVSGGIYADVLNVASPLVLQFAKDVLDEVIEVFPHSQIHIGGDETPTNAWHNNAECQALMQEKGFTNIRQLQSYFVRQLSDYVSQKEGDKKRTVIMWNESLTAGGTDEELIKGTGGTMMCWEPGNAQPCALKAAQYGMESIMTPQIPYYINRKQSNDANEPPVAGYGTDNVEVVYNYVPVPASVPAELRKYYVGIQGTFWTEHVEDYGLLEYLALPRLIAIAETAWSPENKKNFANFRERITQDTLLLNYNKYQYGRHYINTGDSDTKIMPTPSTDDEKVWYRIVTTATDTRAGRCIQLLRENSPELGTNTAKAGRLWNSAIIEDESDEGHDYQLWAFMQDPANPQRWALVNKAKPNGSVNGRPTAENNTGRWDYDESTRHYDFILGDKAYAQNGNNYNYSIRSQKVSNTAMCLNYAGPGQQHSINLWSDPADGNGGIWEFRPVVEINTPVDIEYPTEGTVYRIVNNSERLKGWTMYDTNDNVVYTDKQAYGADLWEVTESSVTAAGQTMKLRNAVTGRYISSTTAPVTLGSEGITLTNVYNSKSGDFSIKAGDNALYPRSERATSDPNTVAVGGKYPQGTGWVYEKAHLVAYICTDEAGNLIHTTYQGASDGQPFTAIAPTIANHEIVKYDATGTTDAPTFDSIDENKTINVTYKRSAYNVTYMCYTIDGNLIASIDTPCPIGDSHTVSEPALEFYTSLGNTWDGEPTVTPTGDIAIEAYYSTDGIIGASAIGKPVTEVEAGGSYLLYNNKNESARSGFLSAGGVGEGLVTTNDITDASPAFIWTFIERNESKFTLMNGYEVYIPQLQKGSAMTGSDEAAAEEYTFTLNSDGKTWSIKGSNYYYWNGNDNHTFTGWTDAHPFIIYSYTPHPYFNVTYQCVDEEGNTLAQGTRYVKGGNDYALLAPIFKGYTLKTNDAVPEELARVTKNIEITLTYTNNATGIEEVKSEKAKSENGNIFDLTGRRIKEVTQRGIYIIDGKKTLVN